MRDLCNDAAALAMVLLAAAFVAGTVLYLLCIVIAAAVGAWTGGPRH